MTRTTRHNLRTKAPSLAFALGVAAFCAFVLGLLGCAAKPEPVALPDKGGLNDADRATYGLDQNLQNMSGSLDRLGRLLKVPTK